jgi:hypothetical protein
MDMSNTFVLLKHDEVRKKERSCEKHYFYDRDLEHFTSVK